MNRCLVFGGSGALGGAVCRRLASDGHRVTFTYHTNERAALDLASAAGAKMLPLDLTSVRDIERTIDEAGELDAFVNCAAVATHQKMSEVDEPGWDRTMDVNVKASYFAVRRLSMREGNIVLVGSIDGVKAVPSPVHFAASRAALVGMAQAMAKELGPRNIRVNVVAPGILEAGQSRILPEDVREDYLKHSGLRRFGRIDEAAALVAWFATRNTYVTGRAIVIDGGL